MQARNTDPYDTDLSLWIEFHPYALRSYEDYSLVPNITEKELKALRNHYVPYCSKSDQRHYLRQREALNAKKRGEA